MQESNRDIKLSTRLERGSPENQFSEKKIYRLLEFQFRVWPEYQQSRYILEILKFYKLHSFYYIWDFFSAKSLYCVCLEGIACKRNIKHKGRYVFPWCLYNVKLNLLDRDWKFTSPQNNLNFTGVIVPWRVGFHLEEAKLYLTKVTSLHTFSISPQNLSRIKTSITADVFSFTGFNALQTPSIFTPNRKSFFTQDLKPASH